MHGKTNEVDRHTEHEVFRAMAIEARLSYRTRGLCELSNLHRQAVRIDRAMLQYLPYIPHDDRMRLIAWCVGLGDATAAQVQSLLDSASDVLMLRELHGLDNAIQDYAYNEAQGLWHRYIRPVKAGKRGKQ